MCWLEEICCERNTLLLLPKLLWGCQRWDLPSETVICSQWICIIFAHLFYTVSSNLGMASFFRRTLCCDSLSRCCCYNFPSLCGRDRSTDFLFVNMKQAQTNTPNKNQKGANITEGGRKTKGTFLHGSIWREWENWASVCRTTGMFLAQWDKFRLHGWHPPFCFV